MSFMGYEDLKKSTKLNVNQVIKLAEENGYEYDFTDKGIRLIDSEGYSRSFGSNPTAGTIGRFMGYSEGGLARRNTQHLAPSKRIKSR